ncbi:MAG: ClpXP protease specificity-enhancing factor [Neisseria sp.]|nr:ClpXP protease specificity-enhancing factor [Neisseria sp.]
MSELKPYFIRAVFDWCCDNGFTPHLVALVNEYTRVPPQFVRDNEIVLNIGVNACQNLLLGDEFITFTARFGGKPYDVSLPVSNIISVFARENGEGMGFEAKAYVPADTAPAVSVSHPDDNAPPAPSGNLKIVKKQEST